MQVTFDPTRPIGQYFWSLDGRWVLYAQDVGGNENFHFFRVGPDGKGAVDLTPGDAVRAQLLGASHAHPGTIAIGLNAK